MVLHKTMNKIFHEIYWYQANLTGEAAGETSKWLLGKLKTDVKKNERKKERRKERNRSKERKNERERKKEIIFQRLFCKLKMQNFHLLSL